MKELINNWREEKRSAYLYRILAAKESNNRQVLFNELAKAAEDQALVWQAAAEKEGLIVPKFYKPDLRSRIAAIMIKKLGPRKIRMILAALKVRGMSVYSTDDIGHPMPKTLEDVGRHHKGLDKGGSLRAAVFGINDGLISNTGLILGMIGASASYHFLIISGISGLLAGSFSMAAGEFVSMRSQREMFEYQIGLEKKELDLYPEEEAEELALIYAARGLPKEDARKMAHALIKDPDKALDALAKEELGLDPQQLGSPIAAAVSSFFSFALGALVPIFPYLLHIKNWSLLGVVVLTGTALFIVGMLISLFTGKSAWLSGLRMLLIGAGTGLITFIIGHFLGVAV